jgi:plastocyanin domain-containing protein
MQAFCRLGIDMQASERRTKEEGRRTKDERQRSQICFNQRCKSVLCVVQMSQKFWWGCTKKRHNLDDSDWSRGREVEVQAGGG